MSTEQHQRSRTIHATASEIFALLADPARHHETEAGDWVRDAIDPEPITGVGEIFTVNMYLEPFGGDYVMNGSVELLEMPPPEEIES